MENYAEHSFSLTEATKKSSPDRVLWCDAMLCDYEYLKQSLCALPALTLPLPNDQFIVQTDASGVGIGAVLSVSREGVELPVAFFSRKLQPRERRYSATELEGLAVVAAVSHFDAYLVTHPFTVETDHRALIFLNSARHLNGRLARWALRLQPYSFSLRYRPGLLNANADAMSRLVGDGDPLLGSSINQGGGGEMLGDKSPNMSSMEDRGQGHREGQERQSSLQELISAS